MLVDGSTWRLPRIDGQGKDVSRAVASMFDFLGFASSYVVVQAPNSFTIEKTDEEEPFKCRRLFFTPVEGTVIRRKISIKNACGVTILIIIQEQRLDESGKVVAKKEWVDFLLA